VSGYLFLILVSLTTLPFQQSARAATPQLTDQQIQELKKQYSVGGAAKLKLGGDLKDSSTNIADEIAREQQAIQPQPQPQAKAVSIEPSAIEVSMRARLGTGLQVSAKEDGPESLKKSDLTVPQKDEESDIAKSRSKDTELRTSWERFLQDRKVRGVDNNFSQFGYQLFAGAPSTFAPVADVPVPPEYVLGPGDELQMQFYGSRDDSLNLVIDREGVIEVPRVGPLTLAGSTFVQAKALIAEKVRQKMIGVTTSVTMGRLRSIRVFVLGDAEHPGTYLVSGLSTMSHALFAAGGVSKKGSLRHIQLKRNGKTVKELDLYDFLLKGNSRGDERLQPGDVIFIPPIGPVIGVAGQANRPAIYELRDEKNVLDVLEIAGGALSDADVRHIQIDRLSKNGDRNILDFDLKQPTAIQNGDILMLFAIPGMRTDTVSLLGHVKRPGHYGLSKDMKLSSLIDSVDDLLPGAFLDYALIQRTDPLKRTVTTLRASLEKLLVQQDKQADVQLKSDDQVYVFSKSSIDPLNVVQISGQVVNPGRYPYDGQMRVVDLLFAAGGPTEQAYLKVAELTRYEVIEGKRRESKHFEVNLTAALAGDPGANLLLHPHDELLIRTISNWQASSRVEVGGEVKYPGAYPVEEGERLSSVLERAGGFTDEAYLRAAVFTRESVRADQQKQIDDMSRRIEAEISNLEVTSATLKDEMLRKRQQGSLEVARRVAEQMKSARATGRIVIELADIKKLKGTQFDLTLRDGDRLYVPKQPDEVIVLGEVYNQTAFIYRENSRRDDYLAMAGGATRSGDADNAYVVRANGMVETGNASWFNRASDVMEPGDVIVVPQSIAQFNLVDTALDWTRVTMQLGVTLASMKTVGVFK
jgi:protein involved in polysaccharide export with SLBB domain